MQFTKTTFVGGQLISQFSFIVNNKAKFSKNIFFTNTPDLIYCDFLSKFLNFEKLFFFKKKSSLSHLLANFSYSLFYNQYLRINWFRVVLFAGLGYKRKIFSSKRIMFSYIADRHWILYKFSPFSTVYPARRRNFIFLSQKKNDFTKDYTFFSSLRKPYIYKMKGFLDYRVKRRFIFIRRLRLRKIKTKLSKKQQML